MRDTVNSFFKKAAEAVKDALSDNKPKQPSSGGKKKVAAKPSQPDPSAPVASAAPSPAAAPAVSQRPAPTPVPRPAPPAAVPAPKDDIARAATYNKKAEESDESGDEGGSDNASSGSSSDSQQGDSASADFTRRFQKRGAADIASKRSAISGKDAILQQAPVDPAAKRSEVLAKKDSGGAMSMQEKLSKSANPVFLVRGKDRGRPAWHYVKVEKNVLPIFLKQTQGGTVDVAKFGKILYSGWGEDRPEDIKKAIEEEYS